MDSSFDLSFKNPCIDPAFVVIDAFTLEDLDYIINEGLVTYDPHTTLTVTTVPIVHDLCGELSVIAKFDG